MNVLGDALEYLDELVSGEGGLNELTG